MDDSHATLCAMGHRYCIDNGEEVEVESNRED